MGEGVNCTEPALSVSIARIETPALSSKQGRQLMLMLNHLHNETEQHTLKSVNNCLNTNHRPIL